VRDKNKVEKGPITIKSPHNAYGNSGDRLKIKKMGGERETRGKNEKGGTKRKKIDTTKTGAQRGLYSFVLLTHTREKRGNTKKSGSGVGGERAIFHPPSKRGVSQENGVKLNSHNRNPPKKQQFREGGGGWWGGPSVDRVEKNV